MEKEKIYNSLMNIKKMLQSDENYNIYAFNELDTIILELKQDIDNTNYIKAPSDKKKLSAIKRVLNCKSNECRPNLQCYTLLNGTVAFTDSYRMYHLKDKYLPFKVCFNDTNIDLKEDYVKNVNDNVRESDNYPNLNNIINGLDTRITEKITLNVNDILKQHKLNGKDKRATYSIDTKKNGVINVNINYLKDSLDILKIDTDTIEINIINDYSPITFFNKNNELALILPVKIF